MYLSSAFALRPVKSCIQSRGSLGSTDVGFGAACAHRVHMEPYGHSCFCAHRTHPGLDELPTFGSAFATHRAISHRMVSHVALQDVVALHDFLWFGWNERFRDTIKDTISWVDSSVLTSPARA